MELIEKRRKHFAALKAQEKRNTPPTKVQKRTQMSTYLKHIGGYKHKQLMGKSYAEIQKMFDNEMKRVNTFIAMSFEAQESNEKKEKKQRIEEDNKSDEVEEVEEDDEVELKKHLVIKKDDDIAIDAITLATEPPVIVDYKLHKEGIMVNYQLIRADGSSKKYSSMIRLLQGIDREDLETLWKLVKTKHGDIRPEDEHERVMWGDFKVMFEPDIRSKVWRDLQGYTVSVWKLYDSCGVHFVRFGNVHIFMLVEKRYPFTPITITNMLNKKLQTDHFNEMCYQVLKLMKELSQEQAYWLSANEIASNASNPATPVTPFVHNSSTTSQVPVSSSKGLMLFFINLERIAKKQFSRSKEYEQIFDELDADFSHERCELPLRRILELHADRENHKVLDLENLETQINITRMLNVGSTVGSFDKQALETELTQLKDSLTSVRIQIDGYKAENVNLKRRYEELSKSNAYSRSTFTAKINA
ncbi:hypothetical protein Tco_0671963 [Tanacetum coccineum]